MLYGNDFLGKSLTQRPTCPFCGMLIEQPAELETKRPTEMPVGLCSCGAAFACDVTGHNAGAAIVEALVFGCNMDWDLAWNLLPEEDYTLEFVENYDFTSHLIVPGRVFQGRRVSGILVFVNLHQDILEVTSNGAHKKLQRAKQAPPPSSKKTPLKQKDPKASLSKKEVESLVRDFNFEPILDIAGTDRRLLRNLQRLLYTGDSLLRKRAAEILGRACEVIAEEDPESVSKLLGRLFYAITDTAAFTWGAFEAIGEIISYRSNLLAGYIPQLYQFLADDTRRAQAIETLGRIAKVRPDLLRKNTFYFLSYLRDSDPEVRGYAAWMLGNLGAYEAREDLESLKGDLYPIQIYGNGIIEEKTIGEIAVEALKKFGF